MKVALIFLSILFTNAIFADNCVIVDNSYNSVLFTYLTPCNQLNFSGKFGDPTQTTHWVETIYRAQESTALTEAIAKDSKLATLRSNMITCVKNWGTLTVAQQSTCNLISAKLSVLNSLSSSEL